MLQPLPPNPHHSLLAATLTQTALTPPLPPPPPPFQLYTSTVVQERPSPENVALALKDDMASHLSTSYSLYSDFYHKTEIVKCLYPHQQPVGN